MKRSKLHNYEKLKKVCKEAKSIREALEMFNLKPNGGNYKTFRESCLRFNVLPPVMHPSEKTVQAAKSSRRPDSEVFCENSTYGGREQIKKRLVQKGRVFECSVCANPGWWEGKELMLQLDHINGVNNDNRLANLRFLCPNCHTQTPTFAGRGTKKTRVLKNRCKNCSVQISRKALRCKPCSEQQRRGKTKIDWPTVKELKNEVLASSYSAVARRLGVSNTAVRRQVKSGE